MRKERLKPFVEWLAERQGSAADIAELHQALCRLLNRLGYDLM